MKRSHALHLILTTDINWLCFIHDVITSTVVLHKYLIETLNKKTFNI